MMLNCLILGEIPNGFQNLERFINDTSFTFLAEHCQSFNDALPILETEAIHLLFAGNPPANQLAHHEEQHDLRILVLSYPDNNPYPFFVCHEEVLFPYLTYEAFYNTVHRLYNIIDMEGQETIPPRTADHFMLRCDNRYEKIIYDDLRYLEVVDNHIILHTKDSQITTTEKLDWIMAQLPLNAFMHVHRWYVVGFRYIDHLAEDHVYIGTARIPLSRNIGQELERRYKKRWQKS
ncbi:DNA-binding LytR/AlgR family response regulator [Chitinophaga dinghuensis]|uniref:DNA-binding LytR/AlgR family response regulator n=1 Tax=Chitinophaga dinghuensis TaxID=1539050 RepID=A0A327WCQ0_9BACT|nr:LytTR family DNA-binding domain-containing protein [Chitinophaga dinghuensis]RAJ87331.1 DNA-binding LytR/AlgR family response regulator [Chitinophaga dinghuensis]